MAFAGSNEVMQQVEYLIRRLYKTSTYNPGQWTAKREFQRGFGLKAMANTPALFPGIFYRMTYTEAMTFHGTDKPDLRINAPVSSKPLCTTTANVVDISSELHCSGLTTQHAYLDSRTVH